MFIVEILKDCNHTKIKKGERYVAGNADYDSSKVVLVYKIIKKNKSCSEYKCNVKIL